MDTTAEHLMTLVQLVQTYSTYWPSSAAAAAAVAGCEGNEVTDEYLLDPLVDILRHTRYAFVRRFT